MQLFYKFTITGYNDKKVKRSTIKPFCCSSSIFCFELQDFEVVKRVNSKEGTLASETKWKQIYNLTYIQI